ncbi:MAG TPA: flagellar motor protein MotB, partial [Cellvibrionaceae bacterium]
MPRRRNSQVPINHERWLVSYADFITLLFAFFVVMYSISQVNEGKYKVLSDTLEQAFQSPTRSTSLIQSGTTPLQSASRQIIDLEGRTDSVDTSLI